MDTLRMWKNIWSKGFPFEEERARRYCEESYDRSYNPQGAVRKNADRSYCIASQVNDTSHSC